MHGFAVEELASVFRTLQAAGWDTVLVGGQAVNVWACRYEQDGRAWHELRPYTSRDLDYESRTYGRHVVGHRSAFGTELAASAVPLTGYRTAISRTMLSTSDRYRCGPPLVWGKVKHMDDLDLCNSTNRDEFLP